MPQANIAERPNDGALPSTMHARVRTPTTPQSELNGSNITSAKESVSTISTRETTVSTTSTTLAASSSETPITTDPLVLNENGTVHHVVTYESGKPTVAEGAVRSDVSHK